MRQRAEALCADLRRRRSVRHFSTEPIPLEVVERCIESAAQAPSGANKQPWTFVLARPETERAFLLIPVGYPAEGCEVPDIARKSLDEVLVRR